MLSGEAGLRTTWRCRGSPSPVCSDVFTDLFRDNIATVFTLLIKSLYDADLLTVVLSAPCGPDLINFIDHEGVTLFYYTLLIGRCGCIHVLLSDPRLSFADGLFSDLYRGL